jgi:predicted transcriptional regulator of viral defense system
MLTADSQREILRASLASGSVMRWRDMREAGVSRRTLIGMLETGEVERQHTDVYRLAVAPAARHADWVEVAAKYPTHCICLLSAARHHGLTTQVPSQTWVALPLGARPSNPAIRCVQWPVTLPDSSEPHDTWTSGVEMIVDAGREIRVTGAARTVVDLCRWRNRLPQGERVFLEAVQEYAEQGKSRSELRTLAKHFASYGPINVALTSWSEFTNKY